MKKLVTFKVAVCSLFILAAPLDGFGVTREVPQNLREYLTSLESEAKVGDPAFSGFSAERGKEFYFRQKPHSQTGETRSCTTCHTSDPRKTGQTNIGKPVDPLAPVSNDQRFTDVANVEKWFTRNCTWVLERECNSREKGDVITYLFSI